MTRNKKVFILDFENSFQGSEINIDYIVMGIALKNYKTWPFSGDVVDQINYKILDFAEYLFFTDLSYLLISEYADIIQTNNIQFICGKCINVDWLRKSIIALHKNHNQKVIELTKKEFIQNKFCFETFE